MLKEIRELLIDCGIVAFVTTLVTVIIRPFISIKKMIKDSTITFIFSMLTGLLLEYFSIPYAVKVGLSGVCGLFAVRLYEIIETVLLKINKNPTILIKSLDKHR